MKTLFELDEECVHVAGDARCAGCPEGYPAACSCGGLVHAVAGEVDPDGTEWPQMRCDRCGRSEVVEE